MDNAYETVIKDLEDELNELTAKANGLKYAIETLKAKFNNVNGNKILSDDATISTLSKPIVFSESKDAGSNLTPSEKVELVYNALKSLNRFVKLKEVVNIVSPNIDYDQTRRALVLLNSDKRITKLQVTTSNVDMFYGLIEWKDGGKIKSEYLYDKNQIVGGKLL
jgi:hypothetical protein